MSPINYKIESMTRFFRATTVDTLYDCIRSLQPNLYVHCPSICRPKFHAAPSFIVSCICFSILMYFIIPALASQIIFLLMFPDGNFIHFVISSGCSTSKYDYWLLIAPFDRTYGTSDLPLLTKSKAF